MQRLAWSFSLSSWTQPCGLLVAYFVHLSIPSYHRLLICKSTRTACHQRSRRTHVVYGTYGVPYQLSLFLEFRIPSAQQSFQTQRATNGHTFPGQHEQHSHQVPWLVRRRAEEQRVKITNEPHNTNNSSSSSSLSRRPCNIITRHVFIVTNVCCGC